MEPIYNPGVNQLGAQDQAMAASQAMVVTGLEKGVKEKIVTATDLSAETKLENLEEYVQRLVDTGPVRDVKNDIEDRRRKGTRKEEERERRSSAEKAVKKEAKPFEWKTQKPTNSIFSIFENLQRKVLNEVLSYVLRPKVTELLKTAKDLKINLKNFDLERILIDYQGKITLPSGLTEAEREFVLLREEYKVLTLAEFLEDDFIKLWIIRYRNNKVKNRLIEMKVSEKDMEKTQFTCQKIAWLKIISTLKELHLNRVLSYSSGEFSNITKEINRLSRKARRIHINVPEEEIKWIDDHFQHLALQAAQYKLNLLKSLQKLSFDKEREGNIKWLQNTIPRLSN
jgi:hypothetical protein